MAYPAGIITMLSLLSLIWSTISSHLFTIARALQSPMVRLFSHIEGGQVVLALKCFPLLFPRLVGIVGIVVNSPKRCSCAYLYVSRSTLTVCLLLIIPLPFNRRNSQLYWNIIQPLQLPRHSSKRSVTSWY